MNQIYIHIENERKKKWISQLITLVPHVKKPIKFELAWQRKEGNITILLLIIYFSIIVDFIKMKRTRTRIGSWYALLYNFELKIGIGIPVPLDNVTETRESHTTHRISHNLYLQKSLHFWIDFNVDASIQIYWLITKSELILCVSSDSVWNYFKRKKKCYFSSWIHCWISIERIHYLFYVYSYPTCGYANANARKKWYSCEVFSNDHVFAKEEKCFIGDVKCMHSISRATNQSLAYIT